MKKPLIPRASGLRGGSSDDAGVPPFRGEPRYQCPITGMWMHVGEARWDGTHWVHPEVWDEPGFREPRRRPPANPPLNRPPRSKRIRGRYELDK